MMSLQDWADVATVGAGLAALIVAFSALVAYWQFARNSRAQRAQWLVSLFERFYERDIYRDVRRDLEWNQGGTINQSIESDEYDAFEEKWTDYLNFFELIAYLREIGQLSDEDIKAMFQYWLRQLQGYGEYLRSNGYDKLGRLLVTMEAK
jgi:hypothetical protein